MHPIVLVMYVIEKLIRQMNFFPKISESSLFLVYMDNY